MFQQHTDPVYHFWRNSIRHEFPEIIYHKECSRSYHDGSLGWEDSPPNSATSFQRLLFLLVAFVVSTCFDPTKTIQNTESAPPLQNILSEVAKCVRRYSGTTETICTITQEKHNNNRKMRNAIWASYLIFYVRSIIDLFRLETWTSYKPHNLSRAGGWAIS